LVALSLRDSIFNSYATGSIPKRFLIDEKGIIRNVSVGNDEGILVLKALEFFYNPLRWLKKYQYSIKQQISFEVLRVSITLSIIRQV
jgi:hypothetical protein